MINVPYVTAGAQNPPEQHSNGECKRQELEAPSNQTTAASHLDLNFPLPGEKGPSCLVKVRDRSSVPRCHTLNDAFKGPTEVCVWFAGVWGLGKLQSEWRAGSLRHPLRQSGSQRSGRWEVRSGEICGVYDFNWEIEGLSSLRKKCSLWASLLTQQQQRKQISWNRRTVAEELQKVCVMHHDVKIHLRMLSNTTHRWDFLPNLTVF